jgi:exonuclease SbcD
VADVHLDTAFQSRQANLRTFLRESGRKALQAAVDLAIAEDCQAVLIAGDLFDNQNLSFATEKFLIGEMERLAFKGITVFYAPGNHDPVTRLRQINWPTNVRLFTSREPEIQPLYDQEGEKIALVVGAGHESPLESENLAAAFPVLKEETLPVLGLLHTLVLDSGAEKEHLRYAPCTLQDLKEKGYTYWALGHVHRRNVLSKEQGIVYPGNLMGRNSRESGLKGGYLVEIDKDGRVKMAFCPLAPLVWLKIIVDNLEGANHLEGLEELIIEKVKKELQPFGKTTFLLDLELSGPCPLYRELLQPENQLALADNLKTELAVHHLEIFVEKILPPLSVDEYRDEIHVLGEILNLIAELAVNPEKLLALAPTAVAGLPRQASQQEKIAYLKSLLVNLDYEVVARFVGGE